MKRTLRSTRQRFKGHKTWWNSLTKGQKQDLRHLAENPVNYDDLPTWSQKVVKEYFEENKELMEAEVSFLAAVHPELKPTFPKPDLKIDLNSST